MTIGGPTLLERTDRTRGVKTKIIRDRDTGLPVIITTQDSRPIIEDNRKMANAADRHQLRRRHTRGAGVTQIANIPMVVWMRLRKLGITQDRAALKKWLSDHDNRFFRVDDGRRLI